MYVHVNVLYNPIINFDLNSASYIPIGVGVGLGISLSLLKELLKQLKENFLSHFFFFCCGIKFFYCLMCVCA